MREIEEKRQKHRRNGKQIVLDNFCKLSLFLLHHGLLLAKL